MRFFIPAFGWALIILMLSTRVGIQLPETIVSPDKLGHFLAYGLLNWLVLWALHKNFRFSIRFAILSIIFTTIYGVAMEYIQWAFFPDRFFEYWDMLANFLGATIGYLVFIHFTKN